MKRREENVRRNQSALLKEKREHEMERRSVRSRQSVQTSRRNAPIRRGDHTSSSTGQAAITAENNTSFWPSFQHEFFIAMSREFTFGDNLDEFSIFLIFQNLAD